MLVRQILVSHCTAIGIVCADSVHCRREDVAVYIHVVGMCNVCVGIVRLWIVLSCVCAWRKGRVLLGCVPLKQTPLMRTDLDLFLPIPLGLGLD